MSVINNLRPRPNFALGSGMISKICRQGYLLINSDFLGNMKRVYVIFKNKEVLVRLY